jgi:putative nucleotidyltransferase with HDIG domain
MDVISSSPPGAKLTREQIEARLRTSKPMPSLQRVNQALQALLAGEHHFTAEISEVIRRDPSLSSRVLQLANSVYFGLATPVRTIDEAVLYLGMQQIRELAMMTPIVEDFERLSKDVPFTWREFWQHCIGTAILTRDILTSAKESGGESDYLAGLLHDVGKIVMASVFPEEFVDIYQCHGEVVQDLKEVERFVLGVDHGELGAIYLQMYQVPELFVDAARFHHAPQQTERHQKIAAAVQIADLLIRHSKIGGSGDRKAITLADCFGAVGWEILYPKISAAELSRIQTRTKLGLERLPIYLAGLI